MNFDTVIVVNYPHLGYLYVVKVDKKENQISYNFIGRDMVSFKPCFEVEEFCEKIEQLTKDWKETYTINEKSQYEGSSFSIKFFLENEVVKECSGTHNCPPNFKEFCELIEKFVEKDFGSKYFY